MAKDINRVILSGRIGTEPEERDINSDTELVTTSMAVTGWGGAKQGETTTWVDLNFWGKRAAVCDYIRVGMKVTVEGELQIRKVKNDDGDTRVYVSINVSQIVLPDRSDRDDEDDGGSRRKRSSSGGKKKSSRGRSRRAPKKGDDDDDLPF
jgi:single stranded DNA-binding protein